MASLETDLNISERQLVTFHLGNDEFGADIMNVKEIVRVSEITKVPNAPFYVEGICNLRGKVLPIIDGRLRFNMHKKDKDENSRVLVIDINGKATGVIVDRVSEVIRINSSEIEATPSIMRNENMDYLNGVVKLDSGKRLIMLLDLIKVLNVEEIQSIITDGSDIIDGVAEFKEKENIDEEHLVSFILNKEEYAIDIMQVKEIIRIIDIVKVPNCEGYIEGVVSIRNNLVPILNLRKYFGMGEIDITDHTRILIVDMGAFTCGIMVDKVSEVIRVSKNVVESPPNVFYDTEGQQLKGVAKLNEGKRLILLLEPTKLLTQDKIAGITEVELSLEDQGVKSIEKQLLDEEQLVTFRLADEEYAINIGYVEEINRMTEITEIPRAPIFIKGIVNLRGNVIPALDLRKLFSLEEKEITDATRIIIVDIDNRRTGIIVDAVSEVLRFEKSLIEEPSSILSSGVDAEYIDGVGKLDEGKRMVLILNLFKVLNFNK
ncbi:chemotaxis protein CheW [Clostridium cylindrosporum]|uniref:Chemotaxis protein CheW n=1 Tax=Clostridium cylindrosporum DSM 605 TaxID=1121307 RepID=A0A0J8D7K1_CLOCY|nr:chemotaxis protein CheW [Clostridium cylindrosporum]KMT22005.1 chemotaxis protein CheW [Clostridium cylindrosporum DSM 605]